jgi:hypothetical protein
MALSYKRSVAVFADAVGVEEAEVFLAWLQKHQKPRVDLSACTHLHAAQLQILMAGRLKVAAWPRDESLAALLKSVLS